MTKENQQLLKNVKPQEVNSLVQTPRSDDPVSGNRLQECLQNFETLEKESNLQKFSQIRHSGKESPSDELKNHS